MIRIAWEQIRTRRWRRHLLLLLSPLFILLVAAVAIYLWASHTQSGARWLWYQAESQVNGLSAQQIAGSLSQGLAIEQLSYTANGTTAHIEQLKLSAAITWLPRLQVNLTQVHADGIEVQLAAAEADTSAETNISLPDLRSPVDFHLPDIRFTRFRLRNAEQQALVAWQQLDADLSYGQQLHIRRWQIQQLHAAELTQELNLQGESVLAPPFQHQLQLTLAGQLPESWSQADFQSTIKSQGDLQQLQLHVHGSSGEWLQALSGKVDISNVLEQAEVNAQLQVEELRWPADPQQAPISNSRELSLQVQGQWPQLTIHSQWHQALPTAIAGLWALNVEQEAQRWLIKPQLSQGQALQFTGQIDADAGFEHIQTRLDLNNIQWSAFNPALAPLGQWQGNIEASYGSNGLHIQTLQLHENHGSAQFQAQGQVDLSNEQVDLSSQWQQLQWHDEQRLLRSESGELQIQGPLDNYQIQGQVQLQADELPPGSLALKGQGSREQLQLEQLHLDWLEGALDIDGLLRWQPQTQWQLAVRSRALNLNSLLPQLTGPLSLSAASQGQLSDAGINAELQLESLTGELLHQPLSGSGALHYHNGEFNSEGLSLKAGTSQLQLHTAAAPEPSTAEPNQNTATDASPASPGKPQALHWRLQLPDSSIWQPQWQGQINAQGWIAGLAALSEATNVNPSTLQGAAQVELNNLQFNELQLAHGELNSQWAVDASVLQSQRNHTQNTWQLALNGELQQLSQGEQLPASQVHIQLDASAQQQLLDLNAHNAQWSLAFELQGEDNPQPLQGFKAQLKTLSAQHQDWGQWQLQAPSSLHWQQNEASNWQFLLDEAFCLTQLQSNARICAQGSAKPEQQIVSAAVNAVDITPLNANLAAIQLHQGQLNAELQLQRQHNQWQQLSGFVLLNEVQLSGKTETETEKTGATASVQSSSNQRELASEKPRLSVPQLRVNYQLESPEVLDLALQAQFARSAELNSELQLRQWENINALQVDGQLQARWPDLAQLQELFPQVGLLEGRMESQWQFSGPWKQARLQGETRLQQLTWGDARSGIHLSQGDIRLFSDSGQALQLSGQMNMGEGVAHIDGQLNPSDRSWGLQISGDTLELLNNAQGKLYASPNLKLAGAASVIQMDGDIHIPKARLQPVVSNNPVTVSNDVHLAGVVETPPSAGPDIQGQLSITLGDDVKVNADNAKVRLGGGIQLNWADQLIPNAQGKITLEDGSIRAYGQNLELGESAVLFEEGPVDNPRLSIYAERLIFGDPLVEEAGVAITGTAQNPNVDLYTQPATNEERALSYLVTGSNFDHGNGQGALSVGIYLLPKLFVSYGFGLFENGNVISTRYELSKRWSVQAVSGARDTGVDLNWSIDR
ncbi:MAG: translocation/assembly module TamB domain-containing protein [Xanthomonadales bacterium]|nr:translocation/assembly module TamB domain-containing protein [Xanthomonadales bacterium]